MRFLSYIKNQAVKYGTNLVMCYKKQFPFNVVLSCDIADLSLIPAGTQFPHPLGIVVRNDIIFGGNCQIFQNVTIARRNFDNLQSLIEIGNNVLFGAGCLVIGDNLTIGDNAKIGAGAIVLKDVPAGATITGVWK